VELGARPSGVPGAAVAVACRTAGRQIGGSSGRRPPIPDKNIGFEKYRELIVSGRLCENDSANRSLLLGWARPVHFRHIPLRAWVTFTRGRNNYTQARNGSRPDCGGGSRISEFGLWQKCPRSVPELVHGALNGERLGKEPLALRISDAVVGVRSRIRFALRVLRLAFGADCAISIWSRNRPQRSKT